MTTKIPTLALRADEIRHFAAEFLCAVQASAEQKQAFPPSLKSNFRDYSIGASIAPVELVYNLDMLLRRVERGEGRNCAAEIEEALDGSVLSLKRALPLFEIGKGHSGEFAAAGLNAKACLPHMEHHIAVIKQTLARQVTPA
jgi:hypothetical protein